MRRTSQHGTEISLDLEGRGFGRAADRSGWGAAFAAAEKLGDSGVVAGEHPSGAKARFDLIAFTARLKSRPATKRSGFGGKWSFSAACFAVRRARFHLLFAALALGPLLAAQAPPPPAAGSGPIAFVPFDSRTPGSAAKVTGSLEVFSGKAVIGASGSVTAGAETAEVTLPHRGVLRVCASTTVKLAADSSVPAGEVPGLMMALDHGALEMSFATSAGAGRNSDILLTPDFRILIAGPGAAELMVRLGEHGDTCVDNPRANGPYVLVTSVFDSATYRVQPGQRVMFQHGSLHEVVDQEKEPCGCPPPAPRGNEFPLAQSEGLAPTPRPVPSGVNQGSAPAEAIEPLVYKSADHIPQASAEAAAGSIAPAKPAPARKKQGFFATVGKFFRRIFGAE